MSGISEEQLQELADAIADKCDDMGLDHEQILDGIASTLLAAAATFGVPKFNKTLESHGVCVVTLSEDLG
ncbi:MAG: hypothetical protein MI867_00395 [Pseudomonadales bacterium]|nr:hypothetical protein [Pseudomonadales bacterium]